MDLLAEPGVDGVGRPRDVLVLLILGDDVDQDQPRGCRVVGLRKHQGVETSLAFETLETFLRIEVVEVDGEVEALDLVDPDGAAVFEDHPVGAAGDLDRPTVDLELEDRRDLAGEPRFRGLEIRLHPAVELGSDPQTGKTASGQSDGSLRRVADEIADPGADRSAGGVDDDRHVFRCRRWTRRTTATSTAKNRAMA